LQCGKTTYLIHTRIKFPRFYTSINSAQENFLITSSK
jgi:hypothetical protein